MDLSDSKLKLLISKLFKGTITPQEQNLLDNWLNHKMEIDFFKVDSRYGADEKEVKDKILNGILLEIRKKPKRNKPIRLKYAAAIAACIVFIFLGFLFHFNLNKTINNGHSKIAASQILPASQNAILIDPYGSTTALKSGVESVLIKDRRIIYLSNNDSSLVNDSNNIPGKYAIQTPKGGYYTITLNDGTQVWLNANSRIEYPLEFGRNERVVSLTGEAYFHVSRDSKRPFYVRTKNQKIKVFGTEFNVSAYEEGKLTKTTLVNGKVSVFPVGNSNSKEYPLRPGFEAVNDASSIRIAKRDVTVATAWKDGLFYFDGIPAKDALQELARWYNLTIDIKGDLSKVLFYGVIERNKPLHAILDVLKETGVRFEVTHDGFNKRLNVY